MSEYLKKITTPEGKEIKVYTPVDVVVDTIGKLYALSYDLPVGSVVSVESEAKYYGAGIPFVPTPLTIGKTIINGDSYAYPLDGVDYDSFNRIWFSFYNNSVPEKNWELAIYFADPQQAIFYNQIDTAFAKPIPTLMLKGEENGTLAIIFFDPNLTIEDYGAYGVEEAENIFAKATLSYKDESGNPIINDAACDFISQLIAKQNYETGFVFDVNDTFEIFRLDVRDIIRYEKNAIPLTSYRRVGHSYNKVPANSWTQIPLIEVVNSVVESNTFDISVHSEYLVQMAQNDGRLMCETPGDGTSYITRADDSTETIGKYYLGKVEKLKWPKQNSFSSGFKGLKRLYSLPSPAEVYDNMGANLLSGNYELQYIHPEAFKPYVGVITSAYSMFNMCYELELIPFFDTSNITSMGMMFRFCKKLKTIPALDTSKNTNINSMFYNCYKLNKIPILNVENVTNETWGVFIGCRSLTYALIKNIGKSVLASYKFEGATVWGTGSDENRQSLIDSLITYSYDRASNGMETATIQLSDTTKALLTGDEIAQISAKGFTIA